MPPTQGTRPPAALGARRHPTTHPHPPSPMHCDAISSSSAMHPFHHPRVLLRARLASQLTALQGCPPRPVPIEGRGHKRLFADMAGFGATAKSPRSPRARGPDSSITSASRQFTAGRLDNAPPPSPTRTGEHVRAAGPREANSPPTGARQREQVQRWGRGPQRALVSSERTEHPNTRVSGLKNTPQGPCMHPWSVGGAGTE